MRLGIAHHFGWAVAVTATDEHGVADRRRIELVGEGVAAAPVHGRDSAALGDEDLAALVAEVRASAWRTAGAELDRLAAALPGPIESISLRAWPPDFPTDVAVLRRPPYEAQADSVMYREVLAELAHARGWEIHLFDAATVGSEAAALLGERAERVLRGPRQALGPPWNKDHRIALAATVLAA